jgi:hypothetical protein
MDLTEREFDAANLRGERMLARFPAAVAVHYDCAAACIVISLSNGKELAVDPKNIPGLETAKPQDLTDAQISPYGQGIYFPLIDADIYIPALLEGSGQS